MENSSINDIEYRKFMIQIIIAISVSLFFHFIMAPFIIDPIMAFITGTPQHSFIIITLSQWFFSFSIAYFYYPENPIVNNYLFAGFIPVILFLMNKFILSRVYVDFLHILPIIVNIIIIWKQRETLNFKLITITSLILVSWATTVRLLNFAYVEFPIFPIGMIIIIAWPTVNILLAYFITEKK